MKANKKALDDLFNLEVFLHKAATKANLSDTIKKAQWLISKIEATIGPGQGSAHRRLKHYKGHVEALINVQKRVAEVFKSDQVAESWLNSMPPGKYQTRRELIMPTSAGSEQVMQKLDQLLQNKY